MSTVPEAIATGRRRILAFEPQITDALLREYGLAWRAIERDLATIEGRIEAAIIRGETVNDAWLRRQAWYRQVQASIETQMQRFTAQATGTVTMAQRGAVQIARVMGNDFRAAIDMPFAGRVNSGAFERWVSAQQPGSPIREVINRYGERVAESIDRNLTDGLGSGKGPREITRRIIAEVGDKAVESRVLTLARTETMRAYRGAHRDDMTALGQSIPGTHQWEWFATLSPRTCSACLSRHLRRYRFDQYPDQQHVSCRCVVRLQMDPAIVPPRPAGRTGEEWLREQPEAVQRRVLRSPERLDAFKGGMSLNTMTGTRTSPTWGTSVRIRPMSEVRAR